MNVIPLNGAQGPLAMRQRLAAGESLNSNFSSNAPESFPTLSIKGKVFRARIEGQEQPLMDPTTNTPIPYMDVVLVNASPRLAKAYYATGFTEGDNNAPNCWSLDSLRPDPSVAQKINPTCPSCPMNQFNSRVMENGKGAKACSDYRRVAVVMPHMLGTDNPIVFMLKIPQSSLKNLKGYADLLSRHQFETQGCITRMTFDHQEAYPKLLFNFVGPLNEAQYEQALLLAVSDKVKAMLMAPDFDNAPSTHPVQADSVAGMVPQNPPVIGTAPLMPQTVSASVQQPAPVQPATPATPQASTIIPLPDGRFFDQATGQFVEAPTPVVDPNVITLPDGKRYNTLTQQYVEVQAPAQATPAAKRPAKKAKEPVTEQPTHVPQASPQPEAEAQQDAPAEVAKPAVRPAPQSLDAILAQVMPSKE